LLVYLDSSALIKRVVEEEHAVELVERLSELELGANQLLTSTLGWIEVTRAVKARAERLGLGSLDDLDAQALSGVAAQPVSYDVVSLARKIGPMTLRSLDAIHCATAALVDAEILISYDARLLEAAATIGFRTESPGAAR
jgi:predicted nucleic acid-binding protein